MTTKNTKTAFKSLVSIKLVILCLFFSACNKFQLPKADYVEGKGYCTEKYDEEGCNICKLDYSADAGWGWICTEKKCPDRPKENENSNKCLDYKSRSDLIFSR